MSTSCVPSPTATRTQVLTADSLTTSFSPSVTTAQPTVSTVTFTECLAGSSISGGSTTTCRTSSSLTTIPGGTTTTSVPVIITLPITSTSLTTLFGSSCTVITSPPVSTPTTITSQTSTTLPNGSVSIGTVTVTTLITDPASPTQPTQPTQQSTNDHSSNSHDTNLGAIIGGVVGGVCGLIALLLVIWFLRKRQERKRWDDIFGKADDGAVAVTGTSHRDGGSDQPSLPNVGVGILEPMPYEYGLVGGTPSPVQHYNSQPSYEGVNPYAGMAQRHSSGGSTQPLTLPGVAINTEHPPMRLSPSQQSYSDTNNTPRPPSMQSGSGQGGQGHSSYHSGYHGPGYSPNQSPPLMASRGSSPMTAGAWLSSQMDGQFNPGVGGFVPVQRPTGENFDSRGPQVQGQGQGSPPGQGPASPTWPGTDASVAASESSQYQQRRLQVMNQDVVEDSPMSSQNPLFVEGRSSPQATGSRPYSAPSNPMSEKQRLATANPNRNSNGNGVMVHQDGGRINDNAQGEASAGPSGHDRRDPSEADNGPPPAYEE